MIKYFRNTLILFVLTTSFYSSIAQQKPMFEFGKILLDDLKKNKFEIDTTADAVVLYEKADSRFTYDDNIGFAIETEYTIRKKIIKPSAFELGIVKIQLYKDSYEKTQVMRNFKGTTYWLENGGLKRIDISKKDIFDEKMNDKFYQSKITFPNVKEGSIIEYRYTIMTPLAVRDKPAVWYFQGDKPTLWSEYEIAIPSYFYYQVIMGGYLKLDLSTNEKTTIGMGHTQLDCSGIKYNFGVANAPAFKNESFISSPNDYISKVEFELSQTSIPGGIVKNYSLTWPDINRTLLTSEYFGIRLKKSNYLKDLISKFSVFTDKKERLEKLYYYIVRQIETDDNGSSIYAGDLKKVFENKKGTPSEQNLMMVTLLRELGYNANPVILSTRENGKINQSFPLLDRFNYTICRVDLDGTLYNLDISDQQLKMGVIPFECLNGDGREISDDGGKFVSLAPTERYKNYESLEAKLDLTAGKIVGEFEQNAAGYLAYELRKTFKNLGQEKFNEKFKKGVNNLTVKNLYVSNMEEPEKLPIIKLDFETVEAFEDADMLYLNPMFSSKITENPFKLPERLFPVDFGYATDMTYKLALEVPKDFTVESLPKNLNIVLSDKSAQFIYNCTLEAATNKINLISKIMLKNPMYYAEQYHELKELYNRIVQKHEEQIVLKRK